MRKTTPTAVVSRRLAALLPGALAVAALVAVESPQTTRHESIGVELAPVPPPTDADVLFDGNDLSAWRKAGTQGGEPGWKVENGELVIVPGTGSLDTRKAYRDFQLHLQFNVPAEGTQNSGVYLLGLYEIQIIDSYGRRPDKGGCGAIYQTAAPPQNASLPPGAWQTYDIFFRAARLTDDGTQSEPARISVIHNGIWLHSDVAVERGTGQASGKPIVPQGPIQLQDHGGRVRFRNIWARPLEPRSDTR